MLKTTKMKILVKDESTALRIILHHKTLGKREDIRNLTKIFLSKQ